MKIGVSGASGLLGNGVVEGLRAATGQHTIVGISRSHKALSDDIERRYGDYDDPASLPVAYAGLDRLLVIPTTDLAWGARSRQLTAAIDAAVAVGVGQIVLMSDVGTRQEHEPAVGAASWTGEQRLIKTAPCWTILRMNYYTESYVSEAALFLESRLASEIGDNHIAFVSRQDVAAAAVGILLGNGHEGAIYNATGNVSVSVAERLALISEIGGSTIELQTFSAEDLRLELIKTGYPEEYVDIVVDTKIKSVNGGFDIVTGDIQLLAGRAPLSFEEVMLRDLPDFI